MYAFGKTIETKKGVFQAGQPLPPEWSGKETIRQLREQYGEDVLVVPKDTLASSPEIAKRLAALDASVNEIKEALGIGKKKEKPNA